MGGADILDLITIPPLVIVVYLVGKSLGPTPIEVFYYLLLVLNGLLLATAFHITVLSLGIITFEIDHTAMIYRDLINLGRLPVDIYKEPLRGILTYLVPVGIMMTLPAKALMGLVSPIGIILSLAVGVVAVLASIRFWNFALTKYTSASS
jgi:ABC-2 type transport system permease protein